MIAGMAHTFENDVGCVTVVMKLMYLRFSAAMAGTLDRTGVPIVIWTRNQRSTGQQFQHPTYQHPERVNTLGYLQVRDLGLDRLSCQINVRL